MLYGNLSTLHTHSYLMFLMVNTSPTIVLSGCNFTGYSLNFTSSAVGQAKRDVIEEKYVAQNALEGLDLDDIFED